MKVSAFLQLFGLKDIPNLDTDSEVTEHEDIAVLSSHLSSHPLEQWQESPRKEISESYDETLQTLIENAQKKQDFALYYHAGSHPGQLRRVSPLCVFRVECRDFTYLLAHCHLRDAQRTFRVDRLSLA